MKKTRLMELAGLMEDWMDLRNTSRLAEDIGGNHPSLKLPPWYKSFLTKLADRFDVEERDLPFKMVDPHLMGVSLMDFSQEGLDNFPKDVRAILRTPEFKGKAVFTFDGTGKIEDRLIAKHPELEDYFDDEEHYWIYIK